MRSQLIGKDPDAGKEWGEGGSRRWDGCVASPTQWNEFEQTPGDGEGRGSLANCSPQGYKESDTTEPLNNNKICKNTESSDHCYSSTPSAVSCFYKIHKGKKKKKKSSPHPSCEGHWFTLPVTNINFIAIFARFGKKKSGLYGSIQCIIYSVVAKLLLDKNAKTSYKNALF